MTKQDIDKISPTFCILPWVHLHAWPEGKAMLCCIAHGGEKYGEVGDFSKNTYEEIMNSDALKQIRLDMISGKQVKECEACYKSESYGRNSFRQDKTIDYFDVVEECLSNTLDDGTILNPKMLYMDFRFSNLCNLACTTCGSPLSSTIANSRADGNAEENKKLIEKKVLSDRGTITSFVYARPDFLDVDVYPYINDCRGFYFAGGEPLMHNEHYAILNYLNENQLYNKSIIYSTNLTTLKWKTINFLDIWKNFNNITFLCSIDGYQEKLEYIRYKTKNDNVFNNLQKLLELKNHHPHKNFNVSICYTHSVYNAYYTAEFFEYLDKLNLLGKLNDIMLNYAFGNINSPAILPKFAKKELIEKRQLDLNNPSLLKAFELYPHLEYNFKKVDNIINEECKEPFSKFVYEVKNNMGNMSEGLPWLHSVIARYLII